MLGKSKQKVSKEASQEGSREEQRHPEQKRERGHSLADGFQEPRVPKTFVAIFPAAQPRRGGKAGNGTRISAQGLEQLLGPSTGLSPARPVTTGPLGHLLSLAHGPHASFQSMACGLCCGLHTLTDIGPSQGPAGPLLFHLRGGTERESHPPATNAGGNSSLSLHWTATSLPHRAGQPARQ